MGSQWWLLVLGADKAFATEQGLAPAPYTPVPRQ